MYLTSDDHYARLGFINNLRTLFQIFSKLSIGYFWMILGMNIIEFFKRNQSSN